VFPPQRQLFTMPHGYSVPPATVRRNGLMECDWDLRQVPKYTEEDSLPVWFDPQPWMQLSEFKSWAEVNQWALTLFQNRAPLSPEISRKVAEWKQLETPEQQALAALRFVQDEIRYFGVDIGVYPAVRRLQGQVPAVRHALSQPGHRGLSGARQHRASPCPGWMAADGKRLRPLHRGVDYQWTDLVG
jgi:hypothetical protein